MFNIYTEFLLQEYNENANDTGIDLVKVTDDAITEIYQIKCRSGSYLTANDVATFITNCKKKSHRLNLFPTGKKLVLKGCLISKKLQKQLHGY